VLVESVHLFIRNISVSLISEGKCITLQSDDAR